MLRTRPRQRGQRGPALRPGALGGESAQSGFTLIEVMVTLSIIIVVMTSMLVVFLRSNDSLTLSRQRQDSSSLATQAMEQIRALPYSMLAAGLVPTDLAGDPNISPSGGGYRLQISSAGINEPLVASGTSSTSAPLLPHVSTRVLDGITYSISSYVTQASSTSPFTLTVLTAWSSKVSGGPRSMVLRSAAFSPAGCLSPQTHPFSGPCASTYSGQAGFTGGTVAILSDAGAGQPITGFGGSSLSLALAGTSTSLTQEQTGVATTQASTTGATAGSTTSGQRSALASASTDPTAGAPTSSATAAAQTSTPVQLSGSAGTLTATPSSADTASAYAYAANSTTCVDPLGGALTTGSSCAGGAAAATGADATIRANLTGTAAVRSLGAFDLARVSAAPSPARTVVTQVLGTGSAACPTTGGTGCLYTAAARSLGTTVIGALPTAVAGDTVPAGYTGMLRVTGLSENAMVEAGDGERAPASTRSGTLSYWNGSGYTAVNLSSTPLPAVNPAAVTATYPGAGGSVVITATPAVTVGSTSATTTGTLPCTSLECSRAVKGGAVTVTITYQVTSAGTVLTRFVLSANLGSLLASATLDGAPSA